MAETIRYTDLMNEIQRLQAQAVSLRQQEVKTAIENIQSTIKEYNLSQKEVFGTKVRKGKAAGATGQKKERPAKFKDPESGQTWSGRGRMPKWISEAVKQGKSKEEFAIA